MKNKIAPFLLILFSSAIITGCFNEFAIPETVSVRTNAEYNFTIGNIEKSFADMFDASTILGSNPNYKVVDYNPGGNSSIKSFLMDVDIQDIPLDFSSLMNSFNFSDSVEGLNFSKSVTVPDFSLNYNKNIPMDDVRNLMCALIHPFGQNAADNCTISMTGFTSMSFSGGYLILTITNNEKTGTVTLRDSMNNDISSARIYNNIARIPLTNKTIYPDMKLAFEDTRAADWNITCAGTITTAKGVTLDSPVIVELPSQLFPVGGAGFESCKIGAGSMDASITFGANWTNVIFDYTVLLGEGISGAGGIPLTCSRLSPGINLANAEIDSSKKIEVSFSRCSLTFTNSDVDFTQPAKFTTSATILNISELTAIVENMTESFTLDQPLSSDITSIVQEINLYESGFIGTYTNTFPTGNDIKITRNSAFFGIASGDEVLASDTARDTGVLSVLTSDTYTESSPKRCVLSAGSKVDFSAVVKLPGYDSLNPKKMKVKNVVPGNTYELGIKLEPVINWTSIKIKPTDASSQSDTIATDLNLGQVMSDFETKIGFSILDKIKLSSLPVYLYCEIPDVLDDAKFNGSVYAYLGDSSKTEIGGIEKEYLLGSDLGDADLTVVSVPALNKNSNNEVITDLSQIPSSMNAELKDIINGSLVTSGSQVCLKYDLKLDSGGSAITINKSDLDALGSGNKSIKMKLFVELPLQMDVTNNFDIDLMHLLEKDTGDLFSRDSEPDLGETQKFIDAIKSATLIYKCGDLPFSSDGGDLVISVDMDGSGTDFQSEKLGLTSGALSLNPSKLMKVYPLTPSVNIEIPKGILSVRKNIAINTRIDVKIQTDGTIALVGGNN